MQPVDSKSLLEFQGRKPSVNSRQGQSPSPSELVQISLFLSECDLWTVIPCPRLTVALGGRWGGATFLIIITENAQQCVHTK